MSLNRFLMWYLAAVLCVGTAGATGYRLLSQHRAQLAAREQAQPSQAAGSPQAMAAAEPVVPGTDMLLQAAPAALAADHPSRTSAPPLHHHADALRLLPPFPHFAARSAHASRPERRLARRVTVPPLEHSAHHPVALAAAKVPHVASREYALPSLRPPGYRPPPVPSVVYYYAYPGYRVYQPGYANYYPSYPYYRVY